MPESIAPPVLLVAQRDGTEVSAETAFAAGALKIHGRVVVPLAIDFASSEDTLPEAVRTHRASDVVIVSTLEGRETDFALSDAARRSVSGRVVVVGDALARVPLPPGGFGPGIDIVSEITPAAFAIFGDGVARGGPERGSSDFGAFGGAACFRRAMSTSFLGDARELPIYAARPSRRTLSPVAALARFEAPLESEAVLLPSVSMTGLRDFADEIRAVAFHDRDLPERAWPLVEACGARELPVTIRLHPSRASTDVLATLRDLGVRRIAFDCDAIADHPIPGATADAESVADACRRTEASGIAAAVVFVVGLPGENPATTDARLAVLRAAPVRRVRVVPFEPTGGTEAWHACVAAGVWPPDGDLWIREVHRPLRQAQVDLEAYTRMESAALEWLAETDVRGRSVRV